MGTHALLPPCPRKGCCFCPPSGFQQLDSWRAFYHSTSYTCFYLLSSKFFKGRYHNLVSYLYRKKKQGEGKRRREGASRQAPRWLTPHCTTPGRVFTHCTREAPLEHRNRMRPVLLRILQCGSSGTWHTAGARCMCTELHQWQTLIVKEPRRKLTTLNDGLPSWT